MIPPSALKVLSVLCLSKEKAADARHLLLLYSVI